MAIDSLNGSTPSQINPAAIQNRTVPDAADRSPQGSDANRQAATQVQAAQSAPPPPPPPSYRGQSLDIKV
ncbi:hypothetical protein MTBLM1_90135 [Rhodospirillaceae bacterium LM-1]|nr:hypothetical protein MTBLM1_90135 [Rhodospirillaceae bacterium LM-1]